MGWALSALCEKAFSAGMVALFCFVPGWLAIQLMVRPFKSDLSRWCGLFFRIIVGFFIGILINGLPALILASFNFWLPWVSFSLSGIITLVLLILVLRRRILSGREVVLTLGAVFILIVVLLSIPRRGEWLLGGWDPGIYVNEALLVSRTGGYTPGVDPFYQAMGSTTVYSLSRDFGSYTELFPGIPLDATGIALKPGFPRMTSALFALFQRMAGWDSLIHAPLFFYVLAILMMGIAAWQWGLNKWVIATLVICMGGQAIGVYHSHTPCSEIIEFMLLAGLGVALAFRVKGWMVSFWGAVILFMLSANRISFILFGALFILILVVVDWPREDRRRIMTEHGLWAIFLIGGACLHPLLTPVAVLKLHHILPKIYLWSGGMIMVALCLDVVAAIPQIIRRVRNGCASLCRPALCGRCAGTQSRPTFARINDVLYRMTLSALMKNGLKVSVMLVIVLGIALSMLHRGGSEWQKNIDVLWGYTGACLFIVAMIGGIWSVRASVKPPLMGWLLFLALASMVVIKQKHAADLYPWATKRFLAFFVPFIGFSAALFFNNLMKYGRRLWLIPCLALAVVFLNRDLIRAAWVNTEYDGIRSAMDEISAHIQPGEWVVCDHFWWGTPLALAYGHSVLNGSRLGSAMVPSEEALFWDQIKALSRQGKHILFLSSTPEGLYRFAAVKKSLKLRWSSGSVWLNEIHQHASNRDFPTRSRKYVFTLYELHME